MCLYLSWHVKHALTRSVSLTSNTAVCLYVNTHINTAMCVYLSWHVKHALTRSVSLPELVRQTHINTAVCLYQTHINTAVCLYQTHINTAMCVYLSWHVKHALTRSVSLPELARLHGSVCVPERLRQTHINTQCVCT